MSTQQEDPRPLPRPNQEGPAELDRRADALAARVRQHLRSLRGSATGTRGATYRFREYRLVPDREPDAEPVLTAVQCCLCDERSRLAEDPEEGASWALDHLRRTPEHVTYRLLRATPVRAEPGPWH